MGKPNKKKAVVVEGFRQSRERITEVFCWPVLKATVFPRNLTTVIGRFSNNTIYHHQCLARVPLYLHPKLELVSHSWRAAIRSSELFKARQEVLENVKQGWTVHEYGWLQGPMTVVKGELYVMSHWLIYRQERETRKMVVSASEFRRRIGFAMIGLGDDIYIVGGVIGPERWNWDIKLLSDVDVLTLGSERQVWRQVTPMTRCRGTVLGCTQMRI
ncbi:hypothetical protein K7X08_005676 [Anisodus acutangulus]|uniref:Uncharacterized protein n=1 Tax=Anisodus acutangulus TaxID=402998 RepID=A0A9Q1R581_9SOLA|nr:hypothetical protein K7X08_005676 [Anisodus acutangulus]